MLTDGLVFTCKEEVDAVCGVILYNANKVSETIQSWFKVIEKLHQDVILGFDWLQSSNS